MFNTKDLHFFGAFAMHGLKIHLLIGAFHLVLGKRVDAGNGHLDA